MYFEKFISFFVTLLCWAVPSYAMYHFTQFIATQDYMVVGSVTEFWVNFTSLGVYFCLIFLAFILKFKIFPKRVDFKKLDTATINSSSNKKSYLEMLQQINNFDITTIKNFTKLEKAHNKHVSNKHLGTPLFIIVAITAGNHIMIVIAAIIQPHILELLNRIPMDKASVGLQLLTVFSSFIAFIISILVCLILLYFLWIAIKGPNQDDLDKLKQYLFERLRLRFGIFKLAYFNQEATCKIIETEFVKDFFKEFGNMSVILKEALIIQPQSTSSSILLLDVYYSSGGKNATIKNYLVFYSKNPDCHLGNTISYPKGNGTWRFKFGHKIRTESVVFDKLFDTFSENQLEARLALKTNVMQDMIDLENHLPKKTMFYFHDTDFIICIEKDKSPFDIDHKISFDKIDEILKPASTDLILSLQIFKHFWLNRKSWKNRMP